MMLDRTGRKNASAELLKTTTQANSPVARPDGRQTHAAIPVISKGAATTNLKIYERFSMHHRDARLSTALARTKVSACDPFSVISITAAF